MLVDRLPPGREAFYRVTLQTACRDGVKNIVELDATFGGEAVFVKAPPAPNTSPADGFQFFGHVAIDGGSCVMTVSLRDIDGQVVYSVDLEPVPSARPSGA